MVSPLVQTCSFRRTGRRGKLPGSAWCAAQASPGRRARPEGSAPHPLVAPEAAPLTVVPLQPRHAAACVALLREAGAFSAAFGEPLWPADAFSEPEEAARAEAGELFGGFGDDGALAACMRLEPADPVVWPEDPPGAALYVHKLAVARAAAGRGWTARLLQEAERRARAAGAPALKLDTAPRAKLVALYRGLGFETVDRGPGVFGGRELVRLARLLAPAADQPSSASCVATVAAAAPPKPPGVPSHQ